MSIHMYVYIQREREIIPVHEGQHLRDPVPDQHDRQLGSNNDNNDNTNTTTTTTNNIIIVIIIYIYTHTL